jgi:hypothetical protein
MSEYAEAAPVRSPDLPVPQAAATPSDLVDTPAGRILRFGAAMELLRDCGIPVAPYTVLTGDDEQLPPGVDLGDRLAVKLADVPHRTELGAVALSVSPADLPVTVLRLRAIARDAGVPTDVAVQAMATGHGEAFLGLHASGDLGPVALFGLGGVLVEATGAVAGRLVPLDRATAESLVDEVAGPAVFARLRGREPWSPGPLVDALLGLSELWRRTGAWAGSVDINPLIVSAAGVHAVDALVVAR